MLYFFAFLDFLFLLYNFTFFRDEILVGAGYSEKKKEYFFT